MTLAASFKTTADNVLATLDGILAKAANADVPGGGDTLLAEKLAPDMFPLAAQVRIACDQVSAALKRTSDSSFSLSDDDDTTLAAARERIARTRQALREQGDASFLAADAPVEFTLPMGMTFAMTAAEYIDGWALAQLYFHTVIAYAILRAHGVPIGKIDFLPHMVRHLKGGMPTA